MSSCIHNQSDIMFLGKINSMIYIFGVGGIDHIDWVSFSTACVISIRQAGIVAPVLLDSAGWIFCMKDCCKPFGLDSWEDSGIKSGLVWVTDGSWWRRFEESTPKSAIQCRPRVIT